ncbi:MAG: hypothetical protein WC130_05345 [Kiritimatiellia bacterium]
MALPDHGGGLPVMDMTQLQFQQAGNDLQVVFHTMMDFLEQHFLVPVGADQLLFSGAQLPIGGFQRLDGHFPVRDIDNHPDHGMALGKLHGAGMQQHPFGFPRFGKEPEIIDRHNPVCQAKLFFANLGQEKIAVSRIDNFAEFLEPPGIDVFAGIAGDPGPTVVDKHEPAILDHMDADERLLRDGSIPVLAFAQGQFRAHFIDRRADLPAHHQQQLLLFAGKSVGRIMHQNQGANHRILGCQGDAGHCLKVPFAGLFRSLPGAIARENSPALHKKRLPLRLVQTQALQTARVIGRQAMSRNQGGRCALGIHDINPGPLELRQGQRCVRHFVEQGGQIRRAVDRHNDLVHDLQLAGMLLDLQFG